MAVALGVLAGALAGAAAAVVLMRVWGGNRASILREAKREAESVRREAALEARELDLRLRGELEAELQERREQIHRIEERVLAREQEIEAKLRELDRRDQGLADREVHVRELQEQLKEAKQEALGRLERLAGLTLAEAKQQVLRQSEELVRHDLARTVRQLEEEARTEARRRARNLVAEALQRVAASHAAETTVSLVELPSDDMKGRIIGREGRNIRSLEHLTGVDVIIDDTPQAVVLSSFDPIRREVAKLTLTKLLEDGRIHPSRIEETYYQAKAELDDWIRQAGEQAVFEANCGDFNEELVRILGRLRYRTTRGNPMVPPRTPSFAPSGGAGPRNGLPPGEARLRPTAASRCADAESRSPARVALRAMRSGDEHHANTGARRDDRDGRLRRCDPGRPKASEWSLRSCA